MPPTQPPPLPITQLAPPTPTLAPAQTTLVLPEPTTLPTAKPAATLVTATAPAALAPVPPTPTPVPAVYTVQTGDTLYRIALKYQLSVEALKAANGLSGDLIYAGQVLTIPGAAEPVAGAGPVATAAVSPGLPTAEPSPVATGLAPTACLPWFFSNPPPACPTTAPVHYTGAAQQFEHGFILWTAQPDKFYIFVDAEKIHAFLLVSAPYTFQNGATVEDAPPPGRYVPTSGFGKIWREEIANGNVNFSPLHTLLGWAVEPEHSYETDWQCNVAPTQYEAACFLRDPGGALVKIVPYSRNWWLLGK
jgi:LysM repeat protein